MGDTEDKYYRVLGENTGSLVLKKAAQLSESTTIETDWAALLSWSPELVPGVYMLIWNLEYVNSDTSYGTDVRIQMDDDTTVAEFGARFPYGAWKPASGMHFFTVEETATFKFDMDVKTENASGTAKVRRKKVILIKVKDV